MIIHPKIEVAPDRNIIGLKYVGDNANKEISALWPETHRVFGQAKAIGCPYGASWMTADGLIEYVAGILVADLEDIPDGATGLHVKGGLCALVDTDLDHMRETIDTYFCEWLPKSGYVKDERPLMEEYDQRFLDEGTATLYFPIREA
jgi:predicted transcriptional regulator YdeE